MLQRYVLRVLYHSTGGDNWTDSASWFGASSVCQWTTFDLSCNGNGQQVDRIYLVDDNLQGTIPDELGQLTALTYLSLWQNQELTGTIPSQLGQLTALTYLSLFWNQLTGTIPSQLGELTALALLDLRANQLTGTIPSQLGQLTVMEGLSLDDNQLTGTIPTQLGLLISLEKLDLAYNELTGTIPLSLTQLTNLNRLFLDDNNMTGQVPFGFCAASFPDWRADGVGGYQLVADCMSEVQCDCCDRCHDVNGNVFCWNGSGFTSNINDC